MVELSTGSELVPRARKEGDALVAAVSGEIDLSNSPKVRGALMQLLLKHAPKRLVLNLGEVPYMDSSAIAVLVELFRRIGRGGKVVLTDLQPRVKGLLEIARLDTVFAIVESEEKAMG